tara:strand:+ start:177 stop:329 length:153 start_codon:yes stop_codon:yes gene_type:complete
MVVFMVLLFARSIYKEMAVSSKKDKKKANAYAIDFYGTYYAYAVVLALRT